MKLFSIETGNFKVDGGAMFGVIPKTMWQKYYPANENNLCNCAMRSLLIITENHKILIDNGCGNKQDDAFFKYYYLNGDYNLLDSLSKVKISPEEITDVVMTHLHFDHCGGGVSLNNKSGKPELTFPNATYWCSEQQWEAATNPNSREKPAYPPENFIPIQKSGKLKLVNKSGNITPEITFRLYNGHTKGLLVPFIKYMNKTIVYVSDLIPVMANIPISFVSAYDLFPLTTIDEKTTFLEEAAENDYILFFGHDLYNECCMVEKTEKGIKSKTSFTINQI